MLGGSRVRNKATILRDVIPTRFADLCLMHLPRPINDSVEYQNTVEVVDRLATLGKLSRDQEEYLETLTILVERFDRDHFSDSVVSDPIKRLRRLMENHDMNASDLGRVLGNRSLGPAILRGDRTISKGNAAKLAKHFKLNPTAFF